MVLDKMSLGLSAEAEVSDQGSTAEAGSSRTGTEVLRRGGRVRLSERRSACPELDDIMGDYSEQTGAAFS